MGDRARRAAAFIGVMAASLVGVTLGLVPSAVLPAAGAATCTSGGGVSVVVDYRELGGGVVTACSADGGGKSATAVFASVGVVLTEAQRQPGFVCRVNGEPASDPCVNASPVDAFWGLWWADGTKSSWTYSSSGAGALTVPAGGSVGWSWKQGTGSAVPPGVAPPVHPATPTPEPTTSTPSPTSSPSEGGNGSGNESTTPSPTSSPTSGGTRGKDGSGNGSSPSASPSASPSTTPSESPLASESPSDSTATGGRDGGSKKGRKDRSEDVESPGDSPSSEDSDTPGSDLESPTDSPTSASSDAADPAPDGPTKVPAALTWGVVGLLVAAIAGSAVVARRRRGV